MSPIAIHLIVDAALSLLGVASAITWIVILQKGCGCWRLAIQNRRFDRTWGEALEQASFASMPIGLADAKGPKARVTRAAVAALSVGAPFDAADRSLSPDTVRQILRAQLERALAQQIQRERRMQESGLTLLASVANVAPFIGLFGTVFGIIYALHGVAADGGGSIGDIAGPVGDALIATGLGIAVAIPAVLGYNAFVHHTRTSIDELEAFGAVLVDVAERSGFRIRCGEGISRHAIGPMNAFSEREVAA
ncbi:MotA/TolQ/ExbB proton channel family protein [Trinickia dinghuensis]|uniref:MotA/TolQ/ExbB proton channel family protein n=1 Tax=Trinickia dinghuensis TaxID=2291023 RepID=A0A3D8JZ86_9BURK|nr:MotA/TolQ/ExbB proton channel family protein [Trinickia dinghuensis]RDU98200.1 MotA/TolQ/ExbB proton channel family protein [Trinickia dinghuensis]